MLKITAEDSGFIVEVRVQPKGSSNRVAGLYDGALKLAVTAAPESGRANKAVISFLAKELGVKKYNVEIISGHSSRAKRIRISGCTETNIVALVGE